MTAAAVDLRLWEAGDALEIVRVWLEENDESIRANEGVIPDELAELLDQVEKDFAKKAERVALFIRERRLTAKAIKEEEDRLRDRRKSLECQAERLQRYLELQMLAHQVPRVEGKLVTLNIQLNPPAVASTLTDDELVALFKREPTFVTYAPATYTLNARAVIEASKRPDPKDPKKSIYVSPVEGVEITRGASLRIR